jgi:hypothetical protein
MLDAIRMRPEQNNWKRSSALILLEGQILIDRHERVALSGQAIQERTVIEVRCAQKSADRYDVMASEVTCEADRNACVEHDAHRCS